MKKTLTLCIIRKDDRILLGLKKRGFGIGLWNGFGGKVEERETVEESLKRELKEESGIEALEIAKRGIFDFTFENDGETLEMHLYLIEKFSGNPVETEEMLPQWFDIDKLPYDRMWPSDILWMPLFLEGKKVKGVIHFDRPSSSDYSSKILSSKIDEVEEL